MASFMRCRPSINVLEFVQALCFEMLSTVNGVGESMLGAGVVGGCGDIVGGHSGVESLLGRNISVNSSSRIMVTRAQFIMLLTSVPNLPLQLIEGWFDALTLQFAHIAPPPAEVRLDFRRLLASSGCRLPHMAHSLDAYLLRFLIFSLSVAQTSLLCILYLSSVDMLCAEQKWKRPRGTMGPNFPLLKI